MNNINLLGRIATDLELKQTANGNTVCNFRVAVDRPNTRETTDFIDCVAWRNTAEFLCNYFHKGKMIALNGILTTRDYEDKQGGRRYKTEVLVSSVEFCGDKSSGNQSPKENVSQGFTAASGEIPF